MYVDLNSTEKGLKGVFAPYPTKAHTVGNNYLSTKRADSLGLFDKAADTGNPKNEGSSNYYDATQAYYIRGSGYNIWFNIDE